MNSNAVIIIGKNSEADSVELNFARMLQIELKSVFCDAETVVEQETAYAMNKDFVICNIDGVSNAESILANCKCKKVIFYTKNNEIECNNADCFVRPFLTSDLLNLINDSKDRNTGNEQVTVNRLERSVQIGTVSAKLTELEMSLFQCLANADGEAVSREEIAKSLWNESFGHSNKIDVYVSYLRKKLEEKLNRKIIFSVRGYGYRMKL